MGYIGMDTKEGIINRFGTYVSSGKAEFFKSVGIDFVFGKRQGPFIWDAVSGKRLINCHSNGGVFNLGHRNPEIIETLKNALDELDIGNHHLISEQRAILAERISELTPEGITYTVFGSGGGEAIDLAIKLARGYTGKQKIISANGGYHGHTGFAIATGDEQYRAPFGPNQEGFIQIPFNDKKAIEQAVDENTAAVIFETIPATLGMPIPDADYFSYVKDICNKRSALLILDEVQTGLGRTGKLWGIEHFGVSPDIMVTGKGLSGGIYPISATCFTKELQTFFHANPFIHISTFGGAEVGCPVAMKVLEISSEPGFLENVVNVSDRITKGFGELKERHPGILTGLRRLGLMMGIEMANDMCGPVMTRTCYDNGILSIYANNDKRISQLLPPLIADIALADEILERLDSSLSDAETLLGLK